ncbi:MAG: hypothetical protein ACJ790_15180 [Myxococcaceae bacterium]
MRRGWSAAIVALVAASASAAPVFVQKAENDSSGGPLSVLLPGPVATGNTVVVATNWALPGEIPIVTDNYGNRYVPAHEVFSGLAGLPFAQQLVFVATNVVGGANFSVTAEVPLNTQSELIVLEYSGLSKGDVIGPTSHLEGTGGFTADGGYPLRSGVVATTEPGSLLFSWVSSEATVTTAGAGYVVRSNFDGDMVLDTLSAAPGAYEAAAVANAPSWMMSLTELRAASLSTSDAGSFAPPQFSFEQRRPQLLQAESFAAINGAVSQPLPYPLRASDTLVAAVCADAPVQLADNLGLNWRLAAGPRFGIGTMAQERCSIYFAQNLPVGASVTLQLSSTAVIEGALAEYRNIDSANPIDGVVEATNTGPGTLAIASGNLATHYPNDVLFGWFQTGGSIDHVPPGWTVVSAVNGNRGAAAVPGPVGNYSVSMLTDNDDWISLLVAFRAVYLDGGNVPLDAGANAEDGGEDGGTDGGLHEEDAQHLAVECGCASSAQSATLVVAIVMVFAVRRRTRQVRSPDSLPPA